MSFYPLINLPPSVFLLSCYLSCLSDSSQPERCRYSLTQHQRIEYRTFSSHPLINSLQHSPCLAASRAPTFCWYLFAYLSSKLVNSMPLPPSGLAALGFLTHSSLLYPSCQGQGGREAACNGLDISPRFVLPSLISSTPVV